MSTKSDTAPKEVAGAALIESLKKRLGKVALASALVPLAAAGMATEAEAGFARSSHVEGSVVEQQNGDFLYSFELFNTTRFSYEDEVQPQIVNWELPLFSLDGIRVNSITSPDNWTFEVIDILGNVVLNSNGQPGNGAVSPLYGPNAEVAYGEYVWDWRKEDDPVFTSAEANPDGKIYGEDPDIFLEPPLILHWFSEFNFSEGDSPDDPINPGESRTGFSFLAADSGTNAPYQASWRDLPSTIGDPPIPQGSAIGVPNNARVPEPSTIALFGAGILGLLGLRRRRKSV